MEIITAKMELIVSLLNDLRYVNLNLYNKYENLYFKLKKEFDLLKKEAK